MPAKPEFIDRLSTITDLDWSTLRIGIPAIGLDGSLRAAGLVTSFAPITIVTSVRPNSSLMSSMSFMAS